MKDLSVSQVAAEIGLARESTKRLIETDQIRGYNAAPAGAKKAAWRVTRASLDRFKAERAGSKPYKMTKKRTSFSVKKFV